jgi:hypothetical protein
VFGRQQGELAGVRGLPVEGHDSLAAIEIVGTTLVLEPGSRKMRERFRANGADLVLGRPLESQTLCRFKEVLRDVMNEKGYPDAGITHDTRPTYGDPHELTLTFTITPGRRSGRPASAAPLLSPAERCSR